MNNMNNQSRASFHNADDTLYHRCLLEIKILLLPNEIGLNKTQDNLQKSIASRIEGKCITEGFVRPNSVTIKQYSSGIIKGEYIEFHVNFECKICLPADGMWLKNCKVRSKTKAGIHADVYDGSTIPITVFVLRDHFANTERYEKINEDNYINVKVIGSRFELNDDCIEVIGEIMPSTSSNTQAE